MVHIQRWKQLKNYWIWRENLIEKIPEINHETLKDPKIQQYLKKYIRQMMESEQFSKDFIDKLIYKLEKVHGIDIQRQMGIYKVIYSLIVQKIILPNYISEWTEEDGIAEIQSIIENTNTAIDKKLRNIMQWFYYLWIWNLSRYNDVISILMEIDDEMDFYIWSFFGKNILWYESLNQDIISLEIPIRTGKKIKSGTHNDNDDTIDADMLKNTLDKIINVKAKGNQKWVLWFEQYPIKIKKWVVDRESRYGPDSDQIYTVISVLTHQGINFSSLSFADFIEILQWLFDCNNYIINEIARWKWEIQDLTKVYHSMFLWTLLEPQINGEELSKDEKEKFKKLLVKDERKTYLSDVWWQEHAKQEIQKVILAIKHEEIMRSWGAKTTTGIVFEWPTGTGKTLLARAIATEVNAETYNIKITDLLNSAYINEWAINVRNMFKYLKSRAKNRKGKVIVILDELDALFVKRSGQESGEDRKVVNTFLSELSGFDDFQNVIFIGTTNLYEELDEAVVRAGRFSTRVKVDLPNLSDRSWVFSVHIAKAKRISQKAHNAFNGINVEQLASITEWFSGADIEEVIRRVLENRAMQEIEGKNISEKIWVAEISAIIEIYKKEKIKTHPLFKNIPDLVEKLSDKEIGYIYREVIQWVLNMKIQEEIMKNVKKWRFTLEKLTEILATREEKKMGF